ncbi:MAG: hypothetical protein N4A31_01700 [Rickettsiales bacterium]|jgi:hypothetical protein|nr:hypothetical protein [Rickettsiales bacterium]
MKIRPRTTSEDYISSPSDTEDEDNFLNPENLVESEEVYSTSGDQGMIFPGLDGTTESSSPYGGYGTRARGMSEESVVSVDPPINKTTLPRSPKSTAISMSPPDNNGVYTRMTEDNNTQSEWYLELIQYIKNGPPDLPATDPNEPSLRDLIYGENYLYPGEVINLANLFGPSV